MESDTPARTEPRWERRKEDRPQELVEAALDLFAEKGFAATRLDEVAARAGVSKGTVYLYFQSKEDLFKSVVRSGIVPAIQEAEELVAQFEGSATDLLREIVRGWWRLVAGTRLSAIPKLMICESRNFPELATFYHDEVIQRGTRMIGAALQRGIDSGEFRPMDLEYAIRVLMAPLIMVAVWRHSLGTCEPKQSDPERYLDAMLDLTLNGLIVRSPE